MSASSLPSRSRACACAGSRSAEVRWQALNGVDAIKLYAGLTPELAKVAIGVAHRLGLPVVGHLR